MNDVNRWIVAVISLCSAVLLGRIAGRIAGAAFARADRPREVSEFAPAIARVISWGSTVIGILIAVAALDPDAFERLPDRATDLVPGGVLAAVIAACGYALSIAATAGIAAAAVRTSGRRHRMFERSVRIAILAVTATVALGLIGVHPAILAVALALVGGVPAATVALLTVQGGRDVARNLAAGRALRSHLRIGHRLEVGDVRGIVVGVHNVSVEIESDTGDVIHVPLSRLLEMPYSINPVVGTARGTDRAGGASGPGRP